MANGQFPIAKWGVDGEGVRSAVTFHALRITLFVVHLLQMFGKILDAGYAV